MAAVQGETPVAPPTLREKLLRRKPVGVMTDEAGTDTEGGGELRRTIGLFQLTLFGVGATIGTGIFVILTDATLTAIAETRPADEQSLRKIPGIGHTKLTKYGSQLLILCTR